MKAETPIIPARTNRRAGQSVMEPLLSTKVHGVPRVDGRRVLKGIFWRHRTGAPWADKPASYGSPTTGVDRLTHWRKAGIWASLPEAVSQAYDGDIQMIDASSIRLHPCGGNAKKDGGFCCTGRSRGGLTIKRHAPVNSNGLPNTKNAADQDRSAALQAIQIGRLSRADLRDHTEPLDGPV